MKAMRYSEWKDTAHLLHMMLQMMGKVKLAKMPPQPEWNHAFLYPTASGFTTGLVIDGNGGFEITLDIPAARLSARCTAGHLSGFALRSGRSVRQHYGAFMKMLEDIGHGTIINPAPQETAMKAGFDEQTDIIHYDTESAVNYFRCCTFAHNALLRFSSPYRGKKLLPRLFWGTFDMTAILFAGVDMPFGGKGLIEKVAFDEQFVEFGFWPGDDAFDEASFFILPYPFLTEDLSDKAPRVDGAYYGAAKKEFFLPLSAALAAPDPSAAVVRFCSEAFATVGETQQWNDLDWLTKPLLI